ncbi:glycoside hydrolase family 65 protein [Streptomyces sp. PT12]|uniref:glycoside hydrolase family 65 protein n=1 Tax=Streptomyces sp. PT12 TaxID=1510197 RepID=UPI000DE489B9|nr:glycosyl hydrolase family 65 protein [Streptomyces sp. PT12]RBM19055.1 trehalose 6-phosphate phosphorylase [Streptomyces sp. PT12]
MADGIWEYQGYDPHTERLREALCTLGNGYLATRGAAPETTAGPSHYPGTYVAGLFNRLTTTMSGRDLDHEDLVNLPNWLPLRFRIHPEQGPPGDWFSPDADPEELMSYRQAIDLARGVLIREIRFRDAHGRHLRIEQARLVHMGDPHLAALRTTFTAEDWTGTLEVESALDGEITNEGVARYRDLASDHLTDLDTGSDGPDVVWLRCRTRVSDVRVVMAARTRYRYETEAETGAVRGAQGAEGTVLTRLVECRAAHLLTLPLVSDRTVTVEKVVAVHTSRDPAISGPLEAAVQRAHRAPDFTGLLDAHAAAWEVLWRQAELEVPGETGRILRLHLFHVLQTLSPRHTPELDVGVPARGLHGEAYRGHVFWDELFVLPYLNLHFPELSKALMTYRYRRLPEACRAATAAGYPGAMYPWQSGSDGREETPEVHLNPRSGRWLPDNSRLQHHVGSAVAYNVWRYGEATDDAEFVHTKGAEMLLQVARFWAAFAQWDADLERYRIRGVVGPDEYHEGYPGAAKPGLDDNAYTNATAAWVLARAIDLTRTLPISRRRELLERLALFPEELDRWEDVSRRLRIPFHQGVISQFDGYGDLEELDWEGYRGRYGNIRRLDRILESEGDTVNRYQASKQADVLMLGYLFSPDELTQLFRQLGYDLDEARWRRTVRYYLARTSHGSTLSGVVHASVLARVRHEEAWTFLKEALASDVADLQGGTTEEGIHLGAMAGTLDLVQRGLAGIQTRQGALWLDPAPVPELSEFGFSVRHRGTAVHVRMKPGQLWIGVPAWEQSPARVVLAGGTVDIAPGDDRLLPLPEAGARGSDEERREAS